MTNYPGSQNPQLSLSLSFIGGRGRQCLAPLTTVREREVQLQAEERLHLCTDCRVYVNILTRTTQPVQRTDSYYAAVWHLSNAFVQ